MEVELELENLHNKEVIKLDADPKMNQVLHLAVDMGETLLKNGGEIFRVEETIQHVCKSFGIYSFDIFILSNGIFVTAENEGEQLYATVKHVPLSATHLGIVTEVNNLSRKISAGEVGLAEAFELMKEIKQLPPKRDYFRVLASGLGAACFCFLMEGNIWESIITFFVAVLVYILVIFAERHQVTRVLRNIVGGAFITVMAILIGRLGLPIDISRDKMIIGSIMPLIPGLAFVNAIRDIANSDFISGTVRIIDALLVFVYIAIGVGCVLSFYNYIVGGLIK